MLDVTKERRLCTAVTPTTIYHAAVSVRFIKLLFSARRHPAHPGSSVGADSSSSEISSVVTNFETDIHIAST